jgi:hypothetical protein
MNRDGMPPDALLEVFLQGLRNLGYVDGKNYTYRGAVCRDKSDYVNDFPIQQMTIESLESAPSNPTMSPS